MMLTLSTSGAIIRYARRYIRMQQLFLVVICEIVIALARSFDLTVGGSFLCDKARTAPRVCLCVDQCRADDSGIGSLFTRSDAQTLPFEQGLLLGLVLHVRRIQDEGLVSCIESSIVKVRIRIGEDFDTGAIVVVVIVVFVLRGTISVFLKI